MIEVSRLGRDELDALTLKLERRMKEVAMFADHRPPRRYVPERDGTWDAYDFVIDPVFIDLARRLPHRVRSGSAAG